MGKLGAHFFVAVITALMSLGCFEIVEPSAPVPDGVVADSDSTSTVDGCACEQSDVAGHIYRFTLMSADEPGGVKGQLDALWEVELENYLLNVLFVVNEAEVSDDDDEAFSSIQLTAGSGWRSPTTGGFYEEDIEEIETFCLLDEDLNVDVELTPTGDDACTFQNKETKTLYFHIGALDEPLECAPLLEPANSTPLHDLTVTFGFNGTCDKIVDGYLKGCLPQHAVNRICMCSMTGTCGRDNPDEDYPFPEPDDDGVYENLDLTKYCVNRCGEGFTGRWTSFGATMASFGEYCETEEGEPGYILSAAFEAEDISSKFSENMDECRDDRK